MQVFKSLDIEDKLPLLELTISEDYSRDMFSVLAPSLTLFLYSNTVVYLTFETMLAEWKSIKSLKELIIPELVMYYLEHNEALKPVIERKLAYYKSLYKDRYYTDTLFNGTINGEFLIKIYNNSNIADAIERNSVSVTVSRYPKIDSADENFFALSFVQMPKPDESSLIRIWYRFGINTDKDVLRLRCVVPTTQAPKEFMIHDHIYTKQFVVDKILNLG
jgi:hypothetical protein